MITVNLPKAKDIAHEIRRAARAEEFAPLDLQVNINIANPTKLAEIEAERQAIRTKYAEIQDEINSAQDVGSLKVLVESIVT